MLLMLLKLLTEKQLALEANVQCDFGLSDVRAVVKWMSVITLLQQKNGF
jgi:hypothetical protein